eukprot:g21807.t1
MERVKLVLQNQQLSVGHAAELPVRNLVHGMNQLLQEPMGFAGLWRGNLSNVMRVLPTYGARFWLFTYFDSALSWVPQSDTRRFISGGLAGVGALLLTHPLELAGLYAGCLASMLEIAPYTAIAFTSYEGLKQRLMVPGAAGSPLWCRQVFAGLCSGVAATTMCYPLDTANSVGFYQITKLLIIPTVMGGSLGQQTVAQQMRA